MIYLYCAGVLEFQDGSVGSAVVAIVLVHSVIAAYVYMAWLEGPTTIQLSPVKKD